MRKRKSCILSLLVLYLLLLSACGKSGDTEQVDKKSAVEDSSRRGGRSEAYEFSDEIFLITKGRNESYTVEYTIKLDEIWGSARIKEEYPTYSIDDRLLVRGTITANCKDTDDAIEFDLRPVFITENLNEKAGQIETYVHGELNNSLGNVYSGGTYDIIILGNDDGIGSLNISYLKLNYRDRNGNDSNIWIKIPQIEEDKPSEQAEAMKYADDSTNSESSDTSMEKEAEIASLKSAELDAVLLEQPMYVEKTKYVVQDERYKALYPDALQAVIKNNSGTDIKDAVIAFVAWNKNNFPVKISGQYDFSGGSYIQRVKCSDINLIDGATYGENGGFALDSDTNNIASFKAIVAGYEDFDGNRWVNPYYGTWVEMYEDKKLSQ